MNSKITTNSQVSPTKPKKNKSKNKNKLSKQLEQEQNHKNEDHMEGYQQGGRGGTMEDNTLITLHVISVSVVLFLF